jgi:hypothetical protein
MLIASEPRAMDLAIRDLVQRWERHPIKSMEYLPNPYSATFRSELLRCTFSGGTQRWFICKEGPGGGAAGGRYGGLAYEAQVYERAMDCLGLGTSPFVGAVSDAQRRRIILILEYFRDHERVDKARDMLDAVTKAARWLGEFQLRADRLIADGGGLPLVRYGGAYYRRWPRRLREFLRASAEHPWLTHLLDHYGPVAAWLSDERATVIHGDFYADNVLVHGNEVAVIDWSWCAMAVGEIDLASITAHWPDEYVTACEDAYRVARRCGQRPEAFSRVLNAARVHLHCRWLAHRRTWTRASSQQWRFAEMRRAAERLGIL